MGTAMRGISKGFNKYISQMFVMKEEDDDGFQISGPTDVKHVAHIGWDGNTGNCPSWMNKFDTAPEFKSSSITDSSDSGVSQWSSQEMERKGHLSTTSEDFEDALSTTELPKPKKPRRKKKTSSSSSDGDSSVKPKRKSKPKLIE